MPGTGLGAWNSVDKQAGTVPPHIEIAISMSVQVRTTMMITIATIY